MVSGLSVIAIEKGRTGSGRESVWRVRDGEKQRRDVKKSKEEGESMWKGREEDEGRTVKETRYFFTCLMVKGEATPRAGGTLASC